MEWIKGWMSRTGWRRFGLRKFVKKLTARVHGRKSRKTDHVPGPIMDSGRSRVPTEP